MEDVPARVRSASSRLARRLALGLFLEVWPRWAVACLLVAGSFAVVCRLFLPGVASLLPWLWLSPAFAALAALVVVRRRAYTPYQVVALADWLGGGQGVLLTSYEKGRAGWNDDSLPASGSAFELPRLRPGRQLVTVFAALVFLAVAILLPQRTPRGSDAQLAEELTANLAAVAAELQQQSLTTPEEQRALQEEIERIQRAARDRVDPAAWESADALKEKVAAQLAEKRDAMKWAEASLARYAAAAQSAATDGAGAEAQAAELSSALEKLAKSGLLANAPAELKQMLASGKLPSDAASLRKLAASLASHLAKTNGRMGEFAKLGREFGRFDPAEFPLDFNASAPDVDGEPGTGGINRGRGDAELTWGKETLAFDRFKAQALPPGAPRSPDDWAPVAVLPGAPSPAAVVGGASAARQYAASAGQAAWRRTLVPRHQSAVKKYFEK